MSTAGRAYGKEERAGVAIERGIDAQRHEIRTKLLERLGQQIDLPAWVVAQGFHLSPVQKDLTKLAFSDRHGGPDWAEIRGAGSGMGSGGARATVDWSTRDQRVHHSAITDRQDVDAAGDRVTGRPDSPRQRGDVGPHVRRSVLREYEAPRRRWLLLPQAR